MRECHPDSTTRREVFAPVVEEGGGLPPVPQVSDQLVEPPGRHPGRVAVRDAVHHSPLPRRCRRGSSRHPGNWEPCVVSET